MQSKRVNYLLRYGSIAMICFLVLCSGVFVLEKQYAAISFSVAVMAGVLFATGFEQKKTGTRRLVLASVMTALAMLGRLFPVFKPMTAVIILASLYLGAESGFLIGAMTAVLSNFYFGQGPWTPFQMMSLGIIGFLSGKLSWILIKNRIALCFFGVLSGILYSFLMDLWTMFWYGEGFQMGRYLAALWTAVPYTISYAFSNLLFLLLLAKPFGDKLGRIKLKYAV